VTANNPPKSPISARLATPTACLYISGSCLDAKLIALTCPAVCENIQLCGSKYQIACCNEDIATDDMAFVAQVAIDDSEVANKHEDIKNYVDDGFANHFLYLLAVLSGQRRAEKSGS
jgi:hypothetical protein